MWAEWSKINIAMAFTAPVFWRVVRTPPEHQDPLAIEQAVQAVEDKLVLADERLARCPFLAGENFTLADIQFGHVLYRHFDIEIDRRPLPALQTYYERLTTRPAFKEHVMVSYEDLRCS